MTENEAIEWLQSIEKKYIHGGDESFDNSRKVAIAMAISAFTRINQLEAQNKAFGEIIKKQDDEISELRKDLLKRQNLEETFSKARKQFDKKMLKQVKLERADAVKEFAERADKELLSTLQNELCADCLIMARRIVNNLKEEMVGDE